jgi:hypothetical protein
VGRALGLELVLTLSPEHHGCREGDGGEEDLRASVVTGGDATPVLQPREHGLDPNAALILLDELAANLSQWDAGLYPFLFQCFTEPVIAIAPVCQQPVCRRQAAHERNRSRVVADLTGGHQEADRATVGVVDGVQFGVYAALYVVNQTAPLVAGAPFSTAGWLPCGAP